MDRDKADIKRQRDNRSSPLLFSDVEEEVSHFLSN